MTETVQKRIQSLEQHLSSQPRSPLFAQLASYYLDAGRSREALDLCDKGLSYYPFYTTGHLIKGKVLLALNMTAEARREFEFVKGFFPGLEALNQLLRDLPATDIDTLSAPSEAQPEPLSESPAASPTETEVATSEATPDQILSQFTEDSAEVPMPGTSGIGETPAATEYAFGIGTQESPDAEPAAFAQAEDTGATAFGEQTGESFENFAERKRGEFFGMENSTPLDEYLTTDQSADTTTEGTFDSSETGTAEEAFISPPEQADDPFAVIEQTPGQQVVEPSPEQTAEDPFAMLSQQQTQEHVESPPEQTFEDPFAMLGQQPAEEIAEPPHEQTPEDPFATLGQQPSEGTVEPSSEQTDEDPFAQLQQNYVDPGAAEAAPPSEAPEGKDQIEELADKLQNTKKITPIIDLSDRSSSGDQDAPSGSGFVTPTLAEIYAKQGWYDDAIKAYKALVISKPAEKEKFESRIKELEELKKQQDAG